MSDHETLPSAANTTSRALLDAWLDGAEATLKAAFSVQNASLEAGRSLIEHWEAAVEQSQEALLDAFQSRLRPANRASETPR